MAKDLEEALVNIEAKLGGAEKPHMDLGGHLDYIEDILGKSSGTKLYKHILFESGLSYKFTLITTNPQPIDFTTINTYQKLYEYLLNEDVLQFLDEYNNELLYDNSSKSAFYNIEITEINNVRTCIPSYYDDWPLSDTTDTVTELYYNLNTYSYYIYIPNEFVAGNSVAIIKLIKYQTGTTLAQAKDYVNNAKNNGLNLYMPESDLVTKRKFNSYQEARDFIDTMKTTDGVDVSEAIKAAWVIETVAES